MTLESRDVSGWSKVAGPIPQKEMRVAPSRPLLQIPLFGLVAFLMIATLATVPLRAQSVQIMADGRMTTTGEVVSATSNTMVVRTQDGQQILFAFERDAVKPDTIPVGSRVRVVSRPDSDGLQLASAVSITPSTGAAQPTAGAVGQTPASDEPIPAEVRRVEDQIQRQLARYRAGVRGGIGLDPEVVLVGVHARLGPFFTGDLSFRPNVEFGFGEVTKLFTINLEAVYRLPITSRSSKWGVYAGAGPGLNFISQNYEKAQEGDNDIDFSDFEFAGSLNFLVGIENRNGLFFEVKGLAYSEPSVRFIVGFNF